MRGNTTQTEFPTQNKLVTTQIGQAPSTEGDYKIEKPNVNFYFYSILA